MRRTVREAGCVVAVISLSHLSNDGFQIDYFNQRRVIAEAQKDRLSRVNQDTKQ